MKTKRSMKSAFLMSVLSLLLCVSMLVSTTFAWFTDSVVSGNNVIAAGNLDIELDYWNGTEWVDVSGKTDILTTKLWEPGVTEVVYLRVTNAGSLALKYQFGINIASETKGVNQAGAVFSLSDYIDFGVVEGINGETGAYATREAAVAAVTEAKKISEGYAKAGDMASGTEIYAALVIFMPTTVGNEANHNGKDVPKINLGIKLQAIQKDYENDSFGDDYDEGLEPTTTYITKPAQMKSALTESGKVVLLCDLDYSDENLSDFYYVSGGFAVASNVGKNKNAPVNVILDLNGHDITFAPNNTGDNTAIFYVRPGSTFTIQGEGNIHVGGDHMVVWSWEDTVVNVYGGNYSTNAINTAPDGIDSAMFYTCGPTAEQAASGSVKGEINIYGGTYDFVNADGDDGNNGGFNVNNTRGGYITLYEGTLISQERFCQSSDAGRIKLAENTVLREVEIDGKTWYEVVPKGLIYNEEQLLTALEEGTADTLTLGANFDVSKSVAVNGSVTVQGNGYTIGRAEGFTGNVFEVGANASLTLEKVTVDGGAAWTGEVDATLGRGTVNSGVTATGALVAAGNNAAIVLGEGAVLQNNAGAHAVNLGTRIGATLTLNGGQIINNDSGAGAIWGGGHITVNSGKISYNSSTGSAGAIRMVSSCNLTMNGGEISNNKAAASGGAIWGYGASTYNLNGGKMSGNTAAAGGAIYTGDGSAINMSGTFEMSGNTAGDAGAMRLSNRTSFNMSGGKLSGNTSINSPEWDGFYGWNPAVNISGGELADDICIQGGLTPTIGNGNITGVIHFDISTNHNTCNLAAEFGTFKFTVAAGDNFAAFNFKPAAGYTYTAGDEAKLICMNEGYETYWDANTSTFKLKAK